MSSMRGRKRSGGMAAWGIGVVTVAAAIIIAVFANQDAGDSNTVHAPSSKPEPALSLSAWIVDWQWEAGVQDLGAIASGLNSIQAFAAYFGEGDGLYFMEEDRKALPEALAAAGRNGLRETQLTVVNDRYASDGSPVEEKDPALVSRLMATEASRGKHLSDLLAAADEYGFHGLELDYERVPDEDWDNFSLFIGDLFGRLHAEGKTLRVVLESRAPLDKLSLPEGPDYVMMAYNLYGGFSGPGPKADDAFIAQVAARMDALPEDKAIALSLGGFDWTADKQATAVTEQQAAELARGGNAEAAVRDGTSGSLHFRYTGEDGSVHTVWYADAETLKHWIGVARDAGVNKIALWRLGGLSEETKAYLKQVR